MHYLSVSRMLSWHFLFGKQGVSKMIRKKSGTMSSSLDIAFGTTQALKDKYTAARNKYKPNRVNVLLIAESPPSSGGYFYSETTIGKDHLFRETMKALKFWPVDRPMRKGCDKKSMLERFRSIGFFLIDTCELPVDKLQPRQRRISTIQGASTLPHRVRELDPTRIVIVKKTVRSEEHTSELQSLTNLVCRLLLEKKNKTKNKYI